MSDTFTYTASDGSGATQSADLVITISNTGGLPPHANSERFAAILSEASSITGSLTDNDSDPDNGTFSIAEFGGRSILLTPGFGTFFTDTQGTLILWWDGQIDYTVNPLDPAIQALAPNQALTLTWDYTIIDDQGLTSTATLTIDVYGDASGVQSPVARTDRLVVDMGAGGNSDHVLLNDTSPPLGSLEVVRIASPDASSLVTGNASITNNWGTLTIWSDGQYNYAVNANNPLLIGLRAGDSFYQTFTYQTQSSNGFTADADIVVEIFGVNDEPTAVVDTGTLYLSLARTLIGNVLVNDADPDGDALAVDAFTFDFADIGTPGVTSVTGNYGELAINANGSYVYTVFDGLTANGGTLTDTFHYTATDGGLLSSDTELTFAIRDNAPPVVRPYPAIELAEDGFIATDDLLSAAYVSDPDSSALSIVFPGGRPYYFNYDAPDAVDPGAYFELNGRDFSYGALRAGENGIYRINYAVSDGVNETPAFIDVVITGVDDVPSVEGRAIARPLGSADTWLGLSVIDPDTAANDLTFTVLSAPTISQVLNAGTVVQAGDTLTGGEVAGLRFGTGSMTATESFTLGFSVSAQYNLQYSPINLITVDPAGPNLIDGGNQRSDFVGGNGNDVMQRFGYQSHVTGGGGDDTFVFAFPRTATIADFTSGSDKIAIEAVGFNSLVGGEPLAPGSSPVLYEAAEWFSLLSSAPNQSGYFILDNEGADAGRLLWAAPGIAYDVARLTGVTHLTVNDLLVQ